MYFIINVVVYSVETLYEKLCVCACVRNNIVVSYGAHKEKGKNRRVFWSMTINERVYMCACVKEVCYELHFSNFTLKYPL